MTDSNEETKRTGDDTDDALSVPVAKPRRRQPKTIDLIEEMIFPYSSSSTGDDDNDDKRPPFIITLLHIGGDGTLKGVDVCPHSREHLRDILLAGERADGSSLFNDAGLKPTASDVTLRPRIDTAFIHPFYKDGVAVLCDHLDRHGELLSVSPSSVLAKAAQRVKNETNGTVELHALGELEYFVGKPSTPLPPALASSTAPSAYHSVNLFGEQLRRRALKILTRIGFGPKYAHGECGYIHTDADGYTWEQHEIEFALLPLCQAADALVVAKWVLQTLAAQQQQQPPIYVNFNPVIAEGLAGSGMHIHVSPVMNGRHVPHYTAAATMHPCIAQLVVGMVKCGASLMSFGNRNDDIKYGSFVRLRQGKESPQEVIQWDHHNRRVLVRLPIQCKGTNGKTTTPATVEFRLGDASAHPHLLIAGIAQAFMYARSTMSDDEREAIRAATRVGVGGSGDGGGEAARLPYDRKDIQAALKRDRDVYTAGDVFPNELLGFGL